ncbi:SAM-dependent methyltransferase [Candidatus Scalindua japonica]|uniref:SAM-dependent methyltransferase n=1 Tax=Candidatus Scalindua japonica TaxID=1284222 RepID=A0A286U176_9BACT|nr:class I SAM-dependent methyltransferase [Candidatus Scalindua japonica]GAX61867.1 SAM-dependent methyltransferase [Candidatus Scalindua japonica]
MITSNNKKEISILNKLVWFATKYPEGTLLQFLSLVGAYQYRLLYRVFHKYVPTGVKVLDWGVGNGHFSFFLVKAGYKTFGYSLNMFPKGVELADEQYRFVQGSTGDPTNLPFKDCSFDAVASIGVLEHVREIGGDEEKSLNEILRVLKPGGVFICYHLPNRYSLVEMVSRFLPKKHHHRYRYTSSKISKLLNNAQLNLIYIKRYGFLPRNFWGRVPTFLSNSKIMALSWNTMDIFLSFLFSILCQNYVFVVRK